MKTISFVIVLINTLLLPSLCICQKLVDFESLSLGKQYGVPVGNVPGQIIFTEDGIPVAVQNFNLVESGETFNYCQVDTAFSGLRAGNSMRTNNINLKFDFFSGLGFPAKFVSFEFVDLGGFENISVNGQQIFAGELTAAPTLIAPGVTLSISTTAVQGGIQGTAVLDGTIITLMIGGQEFWLDNIEITTVTSIPDNSLPENFMLRQNFPNPFNPATAIEFALPQASLVSLKIYDVLGKEIRTLTNRYYNAGNYTIDWDSKDNNRKRVSSGVYFYLLRAGDFSHARKMTLVQ